MTKKKNAKTLECEICGITLGGVKMGKCAKSRRLPTRMFSGHLCSKCTAGIVAAKARIRSGEAKLDDMGFTKRKYVKMITKK